MLDIVIDFVNQRTGGSTKYINQREAKVIHQATIKNSGGGDSGELDKLAPWSDNVQSICKNKTKQ